MVSQTVLTQVDIPESSQTEVGLTDLTDLVRIQSD